MKNIIKKTASFIFPALMFAFIPKTYAAYGFAKDGDLFALALIGFLLVVAGILFLIDYLRENGMYFIGKVFHLF